MEIIFSAIGWLVEQLLQHKLSWAFALRIVAPIALIGGVIGWIWTKQVYGVVLLGLLGFVAGVGILYAIAKKREWEREMEWTKTIDPSANPDVLPGRTRHE